MAIVTSQEYKQFISGKENNRKFHMKSDITLSNGTVLHALDSNIMQNGLSFTDGTSATDSFSVGGAIIGGCTLTLSNLKDEYSEYDFADAVISPSVGLELSTSTEWLKKGVFTAENPKYRGSIITLECLDNMSKFEVDFSEVTIIYPITAGNLLQTLCNHCGVILSTTTFDNSNYVISKAPSDTSITCLDVVSWIAQLGCNYARCNNNGQLEIKWYRTDIIDSNPMINGGEFDTTTQASYQSGDNLDGGNFTDYTSGDNANGGSFLDMAAYHHLYSHGTQPQISTDDTEITGVNLTYSVTTTDGETTTTTEMTLNYGTSGYIIYISGNGLITTTAQAQTVINTIGAKLAGLKFRMFDASQCLSDPSIEAGDIAIISDRKGSYWTIITNLSYTVGQRESFSCGAETKSENNARSYTATEKAIANVSKTVSNLESNTTSKFEQTNDSIMAEVQRASSVEGDLSSSINLTLQTIVLKVSGNGKLVTAELGVSAEDGSSFTIKADNINLEGLVTANGNFKILTDGSIETINGSFIGNIKAGSTISGSKIISTNGTDTTVYIANGYIQFGETTEIEGGQTGLLIGKNSVKTSTGPGVSHSEVDNTGIKWVNRDVTWFYADSTGLRHETSLSAPRVYVTSPGTSVNAANCRLVGETGAIMYAASSSERYKKYINEKLGDLEPSKLYDIPVKKFRYKKGYLVDGDDRENTDIIGFIVEDIEKIYPIAVDRKENGEPEMWNINILFPATLKLVQDQKKEIDLLKNRLDILETLLKEKGVI